MKARICKVNQYGSRWWVVEFAFGEIIYCVDFDSAVEALHEWPYYLILTEKKETTR